MTTLPLGFAEHVLELQYRVETEPSLEVIQILEQMYMVYLLRNRSL